MIFSPRLIYIFNTFFTRLGIAHKHLTVDPGIKQGNKEQDDRAVLKHFIPEIKHPSQAAFLRQTPKLWNPYQANINYSASIYPQENILFLHCKTSLQ